ncbi:hypothetical protein DASC09_022410 [Saccharomycopsis crataegensis]|uniref:Uncharacterized protein n=1 Tax=Saccharomycopsis crataegensis TaxID=43959 RepID=A0AAV5QJQ3_9ASCO|nr:hypothetical protein DASC09_022410 [Saccharomycopsis crataegensis]
MSKPQKSSPSSRHGSQLRRPSFNNNHKQGTTTLKKKKSFQYNNKKPLLKNTGPDMTTKSREIAYFMQTTFPDLDDDLNFDTFVNYSTSLSSKCIFSSVVDILCLISDKYDSSGLEKKYSFNGDSTSSSTTRTSSEIDSLYKLVMSSGAYV